MIDRWYDVQLTDREASLTRWSISHNVQLTDYREATSSLTRWSIDGIMYN